jgi:flagellar motor switch protein FliM
MAVRSQDSQASQEQAETARAQQTAAARNDGSPARSVRPCNFRAAGKLSNENARALTALHETFVRHLTGALEVYLGTGAKVKLQTLDQLSIEDHIASVLPFTYLAPFSFSAIPSTMIVEFDVDLVFPFIDLLLGGTGSPASDARELSEIEEEIMQDMTSLIVRQAEGAWGIPSLSLTADRRIKPSGLPQYCPANERVTVVKLEIELAEITGSLHLVFATSFVNFLIQQSKSEQPRKKGALRIFPVTSIRERILDCDFVVAADLPSMRVAVRDLISLQPGCVLKLRAPVRTPGMLTVEGREIFEAAPVRNGPQKAAQLGRKVSMTEWGKE